MDDDIRNRLALILGQNAQTFKRAGDAAAVARFVELLGEAHLQIVNSNEAANRLARLRVASLRALFRIISEARQGANFPYIPAVGHDVYHRDLVGILVDEGLAVELQGNFVLTHDALSLQIEIEQS